MNNFTYENTKDATHLRWSECRSQFNVVLDSGQSLWQDGTILNDKFREGKAVTYLSRSHGETLAYWTNEDGDVKYAQPQGNEMDIDEVLPVAWLKDKGIEFVPGDVYAIKCGDNVQPLTIEGAETLNRCEHYNGFIKSFADRPNTGKQPVGDDVFITYKLVGIAPWVHPEQAKDIDWSKKIINSYDMTWWKPNHAAMLKQWQAEQLTEEAKRMDNITMNGNDGDHYEQAIFTQSMKDSGSRLTIGMHYLDDSGDRCEYVGISASSIIGRYVDMNNVRSDHLSISDGDDIKPIQTAEDKAIWQFDRVLTCRMDASQIVKSIKDGMIRGVKWVGE